MKKAIVVGHTGQDGTYLFQLLQQHGYEITGLSSKTAVSTVKGPVNPISIHDYAQVMNLVKTEQPDEIYFLAALHHSSTDTLIEDGALFIKSIELNLLSLIHFLEAIRLHSPKTKLFYPGSSHVYGSPSVDMQDELTPMRPNCVYGIAKTAGLNTCHFYRDNYRQFVCTGILFNHESPLRSGQFVSKKIVETAVAIKLRKKSELILGNLKAKIDWGYAPDYVDAMFRIMQLEKPDDFVISSGQVHTVGQFVEGVFGYLDMDWKNFVTENPQLITKKPKNNLFGNHQKLTNETGWEPQKSFQDLIKIMVDAEVKKYDAE